VDLDPAMLQAKLVGARRGGYCHEHNAMFHDVLAELGFTVTALAARVVWAFKGQPAPLTHRLTLVDLPEGRYIVDVGFGGNTPTAPLRLEPGMEQGTPHGTYRLALDGEVFELQLRTDDAWEAMYRFTLTPQTRIDFEVANWYTSTNPRSMFTQNLIVCRVVGDTRVNLRNANLSIRQPDGRAEHRVLASASDLRQVLEDVMELALPTTADAIWAKVAQSS
jgi:N-hydroxyarylamine O-acetyltransferase